MSQAKNQKREIRIFNEDPYDLETLVDSINVAAAEGKEYLFLDMLVSSLRKQPQEDITELSFNTLRHLKLITLSF